MADSERSRKRNTKMAILIVGLVLGVVAFLYGQALGAFVVTECGELNWHAEGRCAAPYHWVLGGIVVSIVSLGGMGALTVLRLLRDRRARG